MARLLERGNSGLLGTEVGVLILLNNQNIYEQSIQTIEGDVLSLLTFN
jgi:hypothetical protein